jgi:hypothetical protein
MNTNLSLAFIIGGAFIEILSLVTAFLTVGSCGEPSFAVSTVELICAILSIPFSAVFFWYVNQELYHELQSCAQGSLGYYQVVLRSLITVAFLSGSGLVLFVIHAALSLIHKPSNGVKQTLFALMITTLAIKCIIAHIMIISGSFGESPASLFLKKFVRVKVEVEDIGL